jgi:hypothetical protein
MALGNKGQMTNLPFVFGVIVFFSFMVVMSVSYSGDAMVNGVPTSIDAPSCTLGLIIIDGLLTCFWNYMSTFLALMSVSTEFALFNSVILFGLIAGVGWAALSMIRGGGG